MKRTGLAAGAAIYGCVWAIVVVASPDEQKAPTPLPPLPKGKEVQTPTFATAEVCALCHQNSPLASGMRDAKKRSVAPYDLWQSTMMANSTRDPLWRAVVSAEVAATPSQKLAIEQKCLRCHAPMATVEAKLEKQTLSLATLRDDSKLGQLALDGVSCTACHQIQPDNLGTNKSFSGHYTIKREGKIFGPHADPIGGPMRMHTGYTPTEASHVTASKLCATCHTLFTEALRPDGTKTGHVLPEQTPYLEWRNSSFNAEGPDGKLIAKGITCQACHVPTIDEENNPISTRIARAPHGGDFRIAPRNQFGRHIFVGGNTLVPAILRDNAAELNSPATTKAFNATIAAATDQLQKRTARVTLGKLTQAEGKLTIPVQVQVITGHKFPTGHPTRRAWLRVVVKDAAGKVVFASGRFDTAGRLLGPNDKPLPSELAGGPIQVHRTQVSDPTQVQVFQSIMADEAGKPTYLLTRGASYIKDNRILPRGWKPDHPDAKYTRPRGVTKDADFVGGSDTTPYVVPLGAAKGPFTVEAALIYQVLSARYAAEIFRYDTPQIRAFKRYYAKADRRPVTVSEVKGTVR